MAIDLITLAVFGGVVSFVLLLWILFTGQGSRVDDRLAAVGVKNQSSAGDRLNAALPKFGSVIMPKDEQRKTKLKDRMVQAGLYRRQSMGIFLGIKLILMICPMAMGVALYLMGILPRNEAIVAGAFIGLFGTLLPRILLKRLKQARQTQIRRSLPDALDVIVVCLEGGLSLPASFDRVAQELHTAHPMLAGEMAILKREIQLGSTTGEALKKLANRFDVPELRSMASVVSQAERFGASVTQALKVHADTLRLKRFQHAEAMAQKAPIKLIFPVALCILPALYIIMMAPALLTVFEAFQAM